MILKPINIYDISLGGDGRHGGRRLGDRRRFGWRRFAWGRLGREPREGFVVAVVADGGERLGTPAGLTDPALSDPALPDPALPDRALPDPALPDPALLDPALPDRGSDWAGSRRAGGGLGPYDARNLAPPLFFLAQDLIAETFLVHGNFARLCFFFLRRSLSVRLENAGDLPLPFRLLSQNPLLQVLEQGLGFDGLLLGDGGDGAEPARQAERRLAGLDRFLNAGHGRAGLRVGAGGARLGRDELRLEEAVRHRGDDVELAPVDHCVGRVGVLTCNNQS